MVISNEVEAVPFLYLTNASRVGCVDLNKGITDENGYNSIVRQTIPSLI